MDPLLQACHEAKETAEEAVRQAVRYGADQADAVVICNREFQIVIRDGQTDLVKQAADRTLNLRAFDSHRSASASTSAFATPALETLASTLLAAVRCTPPDLCAGLADRERYSEIPLSSSGVDADGWNTPMEARMRLAREAERAGFAFDPRVQYSEGATLGGELSIFACANSHGYSSVYPESLFSLFSVPVATAGDRKQRDHWISLSRRLAGLAPPGEVGRRAGERAVRRLGAKKIPSCRVPVVFDPVTGASLVRDLCQAVNGAAVYRGASFLAGRLGEVVASPSVTVVDDPGLPEGPTSRPFDAEGLPAGRLFLIESGRLKQFLLDTYSARKLGLTSNGRARRGTAGGPAPGPSNFFLQPGQDSPASLIRSVKKGLYVTELIGFGVDIVSGDYSRGAFGFWIEDGEFAHPVEEITIAGSLQAMLTGIDAVGSDLEFLGPVASPTFRVAEMTVSGQ